MQVKATVKISHVDLAKSKKLMDKANEANLYVWRSFACHLDLKYLTCPEKIDNSHFLLQVPPGINYVPRVGDIVHVIKSKKFANTWVLDNEFKYENGPKSPFTYTRGEDKKHPITYEFEGKSKEIMGYKSPEFSKTDYFSIRPVMCWYNPITLERTCEVITNGVIELNQMFDEIIWTLYEHQKNGAITAIADFNDVPNAERVQQDFETILETLIKLQS